MVADPTVLAELGWNFLEKYVFLKAWTSLIAQTVKRLLTIRETQVQSLALEDLLEEEMATHSSILAWRIPWMEESGRPRSTGPQRSDTTERLHF